MKLNLAMIRTHGKVQVLDTPYPGTKIYRPSSKGPHRAVVILHGSEGGAAGFTDLEAINSPVTASSP
jgi:poly(3-hydroxybutyrate) depolymerase